jgi:D-galactarolactone cycloisomerase
MWPEACAATAQIIKDGLAPLLLGKDLDTDSAWTTMKEHTWWYGEGGIASFALSAIDIALWDIKGKETGKPLYELLEQGDAASLCGGGRRLFLQRL